MGEDSGYFSRRSNEFRLPAHHSHSSRFANTKSSCHCLRQRICCYCDPPYSCKGSPPRTYECSCTESSICDNDGITDSIASTTDPQCSTTSNHGCQCNNSIYNNNNNKNNNNNINVDGNDRRCPYYCDYHYYHLHNTNNQQPKLKSFTGSSPDSRSCTKQQKTWIDDGDPQNNNNNPSDTIPSPHPTERFSHPPSVYPGSGLTATTSQSVGSRGNSANLRDDDNNTPASSAGYQSSSGSLVGRARFSPNDIIKLGYKDLLRHPALKRFSYGFQDEQEFEEFKQDLRDFQLSKIEPNAEDVPSSPSSGYWPSCRSSRTTRETSPDSEGESRKTGRDLVDHRGRYNTHHRPHPIPIPDDREGSNFCIVKKESCDHDYSGGSRREVKRSITFSSFNADRSGRIPGTDVLESPFSTNCFSSVSPSKFSPTFNRYSPLTERGVGSPFSSSPLLSDNNNTRQQVSPLTITRHSPKSLPSFKHLTPSLRNTSAPHDMLMDFFKSDEHFQEFEREFANLGRDFDVFNRRRRTEDGDGDGSRSLSRVGIEPGTSSSGSATPIPIPVHIDSPRGTDPSGSGTPGCRTPIPIQVNYRPGVGSREPTPRTELMMYAGDGGGGAGDLRPPNDQVDSFFHNDDAFSDFFNNDEDFKEFEREFANFKLKRRSRAFADDFNRRSNCDLIADLFPGYEGNPPRDIRRSRGSASDWDYLFNKIKRNSNIFSEPSHGLSDNGSDGESSVFLDDDKRAPTCQQPLQPYSEQSRPPRKSVEIAIQRRPPLPASPARRHSPDVSRSPVFKHKPLELKIEHFSSPCSSPTSSPRTPVGAPFAPRSRTDSPLLLHINEDDLRDSSSPVRRVLQFDESDSEPTTPTNSDPTVLHIDDEPYPSNDDDGGDEDGEHIVIEHRFSEGIATPTTTITRRRKGSSSSSTSERAASPASPRTVRHQNNQSPQQRYKVQPSSELTDRRRFTDPSRMVPEMHSGGPDSSKQNRFSTALEFLHDDENPNKSSANNASCQHKPHDKEFFLDEDSNFGFGLFGQIGYYSFNVSADVTSGHQDFRQVGGYIAGNIDDEKMGSTNNRNKSSAWF